MSRTHQGAPSAHSKQRLKRRQRCVAAAMALSHVLPMTLPQAAHAQQALPAPLPAGTTVFNYDAQGNPKQTIDPNNRSTDQEFDNLNRVKKQVLPAPRAGASRPEVKFEYDGQGRIKRITERFDHVCGAKNNQLKHACYHDLFESANTLG